MLLGLLLPDLIAYPAPRFTARVITRRVPKVGADRTAWWPVLGPQ